MAVTVTVCVRPSKARASLSSNRTAWFAKVPLQTEVCEPVSVGVATSAHAASAKSVKRTNLLVCAASLLSARGPLDSTSTRGVLAPHSTSDAFVMPVVATPSGLHVALDARVTVTASPLAPVTAVQAHTVDSPAPVDGANSAKA